MASKVFEILQVLRKSKSSPCVTCAVAKSQSQKQSSFRPGYDIVKAVENINVVQQDLGHWKRKRVHEPRRGNIRARFNMEAVHRDKNLGVRPINRGIRPSLSGIAKRSRLVSDGASGPSGNHNSTQTCAQVQAQSGDQYSLGYHYGSKVKRFQCSRIQEPTKNGVSYLTCQLVSPGSPEICIRYAVRLGRGAVRSGAAKVSRWRDPRANCTVKRSPIKSDPSSVDVVSAIESPYEDCNLRKAAQSVLVRFVLSEVKF